MLINNKSEQGYIEMFTSFKNILTLENSFNLNLRSITTDFEIALKNALRYVFPDIIQIRCYYHFCMLLEKKLKNWFIIRYF